MNRGTGEKSLNTENTEETEGINIIVEVGVEVEEKGSIHSRFVFLMLLQTSNLKPPFP